MIDPHLWPLSLTQMSRSGVPARSCGVRSLWVQVARRVSVPALAFAPVLRVTASVPGCHSHPLWRALGEKAGNRVIELCGAHGTGGHQTACSTTFSPENLLPLEEVFVRLPKLLRGGQWPLGRRDGGLLCVGRHLVEQISFHLNKEAVCLIKMEWVAHQLIRVHKDQCPLRTKVGLAGGRVLGRMIAGAGKDNTMWVLWQGECSGLKIFKCLRTRQRASSVGRSRTGGHKCGRCLSSSDMRG